VNAPACAVDALTDFVVDLAAKCEPAGLLAETTVLTIDERLEAAYAEVRTKALAEAKAEVVEWLAKKAHEGTEVSRLADKVERGAIQLFFDAERSAAATAPQHYDKAPDPADGCHWCACGNRWPCKDTQAVTA
jgi:hypothetical protein